MEVTKDFQLGENTYQFSRFSARTGSWIVFQFLTRNLLLPALSNNAEEISEKDLATGLGAALREFPEDLFNSVQSKTFDVIKRYDANRVPMPLFHKDTGADLFGLSPVETTVLMVAALAFNLHCFFESGAAKLLLTTFPDLSNPVAPGPTLTS